MWTTSTIRTTVTFHLCNSFTLFLLLIVTKTNSTRRKGITVSCVQYVIKNKKRLKCGRFASFFLLSFFLEENGFFYKMPNASFNLFVWVGLVFVLRLKNAKTSTTKNGTNCLPCKKKEWIEGWQCNRPTFRVIVTQSDTFINVCT